MIDAPYYTKYTFFNYKKIYIFLLKKKPTKMLHEICLKEGIILHENIKSLIDVLTYHKEKSEWKKPKRKR